MNGPRIFYYIVCNLFFIPIILSGCGKENNSYNLGIDGCVYVAEQVKKRFGIEECIINHVGPSIGAHSGPGTMALFFMGNQR